TLDGRHEVNEVFLDAVRVPVSLRVGEENAGWDITKFLLGHERAGIARIGMTKRLIARAKALAAQVAGQHGTLADEPRFRLRAASIYGGSNEVQKNILAKSVLGLGR